MKYQVLGPRILIKVPKVSEYFPGSTIAIPESSRDQHTTGQTVGEVVQLGETAYKREDAWCNNKDWVKPGDRVHFNQYGAKRINYKESDTEEFWILMDRDVLCIEHKE